MVTPRASRFARGRGRRMRHPCLSIYRGFTNRRSALSRPRALAFQWPRLSVSRAAPLTRLALAARAAGQKYDGHAAVFAFCAWPRPTYASSVRSRRVSAPDLPRLASGVCFFFVQVSWWSRTYVIYYILSYPPTLRVTRRVGESVLSVQSVLSLFCLFLGRGASENLG